MREEFKSRRGYDPLEFLPILGGYTNLYTAAEVAAFRKDFDRTVMDLYRDVLFKRMSERIRAEGLAFVNKSDRDAAFGLAGRWYDPVNGTIGEPPPRLARRQSGFFEHADLPRHSEPASALPGRMLSFEPAVGDRSLSSDPAVRYFSGTFRYRATFDAAARNESLTLDLVDGFDQIFEIWLNGTFVGTVWCAPWLARLPPRLVKAKGNVLEIDVTNSWRNRLVGDEQEAPDCIFENAPLGPGAYLVRYPEWFGKGVDARPSAGRKCFTTWNYFDKASSLSPSGLVRAPVLRTVRAPLQLEQDNPPR